jgi:YVTN family beta-propeller protein
MRFSRILIATALSLASSLPVVAAPIAYASNEGSGTVSMIDTATDKVTATFSVGGKPRGIALSPDGKRLYLSDQTANAVLTVDAATGAVLTRTALGKSSSPCPRQLFLERQFPRQRQGYGVVDTASGKVVRKLKMRGKNPEHAVFSPDDRWLYVSSEEADSVDIVDLGKGEVVQSVKVGDRPRGIGFLPDGKRAYVAAEHADTVNVIDVATMEVIASIKAGSRSNGVTVRPDGKRVYVSSGGDGTVQVIDTASNAIIAAIPVGKRPWNMAITPDGQALRRMRAVECDRGRRYRDQCKIADIAVGDLPWGVALR